MKYPTCRIAAAGLLIAAAAALAVAGPRPEVIAKIEVGETPFTPDVDAILRQVYIPNLGDNTISVIDSTHTVIATLRVGAKPLPGCNPLDGQVYVANIGDDTVSLIDGNDLRVTGTVEVPTGSFCVSRFNGRAYVPSGTRGEVAVIDGVFGVVDKISLDGWPHLAAVDPIGERVFIPRYRGHSVTVIDEGSGLILADIPVGGPAGAVGVNPLTGKAAVSVSQDVAILDRWTNMILTTTHVGRFPGKPVYNLITNRIYVSNRLDGNVVVLDGVSGRRLATIAVGERPSTPAVNHLTNRIYVVNTEDSTLSVIDGLLDQVVSTLAVGDRSGDPAIDPFLQRLYISSAGENRVAVVEDRASPLRTTETLTAAIQGLMIDATTTLPGYDAASHLDRAMAFLLDRETGNDAESVTCLLDFIDAVEDERSVAGDHRDRLTREAQRIVIMFLGS